MNEYGGGFKTRTWFMAAGLAAVLAGCGSGDEIFGTSGASGPGPAGAAPNLGAAGAMGGFSGGGGAGATNQGILTRINGGNLSTTATVTSAVTGFHDSAAPVPDIYTETGSNIGAVSGLIYTCTVSTTGPTSGGVNAASCTIANNALAAAQAAFLDLSPASRPGGLNPGANLSGLTLAPGLYTAPAGSFLIQNGTINPAGDLTLDGQGNLNAVWVFQMASSLTVGGPGAAFPRSVNCINGCQAKNVFWQVGSSATINAAGGGTMVGTIISSAAISLSTAGNVSIMTLNGRAMALNASVTMTNTIINIPAP
jgi:hypothetical protein